MNVSVPSELLMCEPPATLEFRDPMTGEATTFNYMRTIPARKPR